MKFAFCTVYNYIHQHLTVSDFVNTSHSSYLLNAYYVSDTVLDTLKDIHLFDL